ncbi:MAG: helix-turn-helix transcriptional regulator [Candidatus Eremiobacteraeota bacterium]|nr:helix-turn-helix transcriptional regulator [Candidatus Eremiobacteraeota bacterium]
MTDERALRKTELRSRLAAAGLTLAEFQRRSGLSRNVVYNLARGQQPKPDHVSKIEEAFRQGRR